MIVSELIEILKQYPQHAAIVINGYEGGYETDFSVTELELRRNYFSDGYSGPHELKEHIDFNSTPEDIEENESKWPSFKAIAIERLTE